MKKAVIILCLLCILTGCTANITDLNSKTQWLMGTMVTLSCSDEAMMDEAFHTIRELEKGMNDFQQSINRHGSAEGDEVIAACIEVASLVHGLSGGAFDITVYPALELWGLLPGNWQETLDKLPSESDIVSVQSYIDMTKIETDDGTYTVPSVMQMELGGVGKGVAANIVSEQLQGQGITSALLTFGGSITAIGDKGGQPFVVGIRDPLGGDVMAKLPLSDTSIATAGAYERYIIIDEVKYGHIINPHTARPAESDVLSATVVCADAALADALSTACFVLGRDGALEMIEALDGAEVLLVLEDGTVEATQGIRPAVTLLDSDWRWAS